MTKFNKQALPIMDLLTTDRQQALDRGLQEIVPHMSSISNDIDSLFKWLKELLDNEKEKEIQEDARSSLSQVLLLSAFATILAIIFGVFLAIVITKPILLVMNQMKLIADGDLSNKPLKVKSKDEVGQLMVSTNEMASSMQNLLNQINIVSGSVTGQSEELIQSSDEVNAATHQIAVTMQELAVGIEGEARSASDLAVIMESFTSKVEEANEKGEHIQRSSSEVLTMTSEGSQLMESSNEQMVKIDQIVKEAVQKIQGLDAQSQEISNLVVVIKDIVIKRICWP